MGVFLETQCPGGGGGGGEGVLWISSDGKTQKNP